MEDQWRHKDIWKREGRFFLVEISRHSVDRFDPGEGPHRWCIYAYIYPQHPYFERFDVDGPMFQEAASALPLHGGPSFFRAHYDRKGEKFTSIQVGADYNHLYDDRFCHDATREDAQEVFKDATHLFDWLEMQAEQPALIKEPQP